MSDQAIDIDLLLERIQERLNALKLSERKASLIATGRPDAIRYIRTRRSTPSMGRLMKLAAALETSGSYLIGKREDPEEEPHVTKVIKTMTDKAAEDLTKIAERNNENNAFPVWEVTPVDYVLFDTPTRDKKAVNIYRFGPTIIGVAEAPPLLKDSALVGFKMPDSTMQPIYEAGEAIYAQRNVKINYRDDLVLGITTEDGKISGNFIIGRLMSKTLDALELRQFGSGSSFRVPVDRIEVLYRILRVADLMGEPTDAAIMPHSD